MRVQTANRGFVEVERNRYDYLIERTEMFNDFLEYLSDWYLVGDIDTLWGNFRRWRELDARYILRINRVMPDSFIANRHLLPLIN